MTVSRREFLKSAGVSGLATAVTGASAAEALQSPPGPAVVGPGEVPVTLTVNGKRLDLHIEPRVTLLDASATAPTSRATNAWMRSRRVRRMHDDRGRPDGLFVLNARHRSSGQTDPHRRWLGRSATTLHPVQQAFCDADALMCGFCTPGFVMATVALLEKYPNATPRTDAQRARRQHLPLRNVRRILEAA